MRFWTLPIRKQRIRKTKGDRKPKGKRKQKGNRKSKDKRKPKDGKRNRKAAATSLPPCMAPTTAQRCGRCAASGTTRWIGRGTGGRLSAPTTLSAPRSSAGSEGTAGFRRCSVPCWIGWSPGCGKAAWRTRHIRISIKSGIHCAQVTNRGGQSRPPLLTLLTPNRCRGGRLCRPCSIKQQKRRPAPSLLSFRLPLYHNIAPRLYVKGLKIHLLKGDPAVTEHLRLLRAVAAFDAPQLLLRRNG